MVTSIARQSVIIKCNMQASVLLGNYEFYYAAGLFCQIRELSTEEDILPEALSRLILPELKKASGKDPKEQYLIKLLSGYEPSEDYDDQMKELLLWGLNEERIWQIN